MQAKNRQNRKESVGHGRFTALSVIAICGRRAAAGGIVIRRRDGGYRYPFANTTTMPLMIQPIQIIDLLLVAV